MLEGKEIEVTLDIKKNLAKKRRKQLHLNGQVNMIACLKLHLLYINYFHYSVYLKMFIALNSIKSFFFLNLEMLF